MYIVVNAYETSGSQATRGLPAMVHEWDVVPGSVLSVEIETNQIDQGNLRSDTLRIT